ncbi:MAG: hypothetical protein ACI4S2_13110 [Lachnospiraceae bacterium]
MNKICFFIKQQWQLLLCFLCGIVYFLLMFRFYMVDYDVPDFRLYESFYEDCYLAKDGFSTLFIWIAHFAITHPRRLTVFCLLLMSFAFINMLIGVSMLFKEKIFKWLLGVIFSVVCGCWYYFYGKIFYDFPFSAYTYSVGFVLVIDLLRELESNQKNEKKVSIEWLAIMAVLGFMMTWKPYNIFLLVGLWLLAINNESCSEFFWGLFKKIRQILLTLVFFGLGYIAGNYGLLIRPKETISGIRAYAASFDFIDFLFKGKEQIWDHVNSVSFNEGILAILSLCLVLFVVPILLKRWTYLCISLVMILGYALYIYECSPGYLWHGLPFGLFVVTYMIFLIRDIDDGSLRMAVKRLSYGAFIIAILYQGYNCFAEYVPKQTHWHNKTEEAINVLENNYEDIALVIEDYYGQLTNAGYSVTYDNAVKRYRPCNYSDRIKFVDPLEYMIITSGSDSSWITNIRELSDTDYVIYVLPNAMLEIDDVTCARKYDEDNIIAVTEGDGYEIKVVQCSYKYY